MVLGDQVALPSVTQTAAQFAHYLDRPYPAQGKPIWYDLYISLQRILIGFVIGVVAGIALGAAMSASRVVRHLVDPVIEVLRPLPPLAFIPLFIVWLGIGELPKEVLIIVGVIPLMAVTTVAALDEVPGRPAAVRPDPGRVPPLHPAARPDPVRAAVHPDRHAVRHGRGVEQHRRRRAARRDQRPRVHDHAGRRLPGHRPGLRRDHHHRRAGLILDAVLRSLLLLADPSRRR